MKKTFDQICADILGETVLTPTPKPTTTPTSVQQPTQQQPQQSQQNQPAQPTQQAPDLKALSTQLAKLTDSNEIEKVLSQLLNPNAAIKPA